MRQAVALQMSPTPAAGVSLISENWSLLNIPMDVPEPPPAPRRRMPPSAARGRPLSTSAPAGTSSGVGHNRQQSSQQLGFPEMLARGILERGESLGINKSLMSAVSELKVRPFSHIATRHLNGVPFLAAKYPGHCVLSHSLTRSIIPLVPLDC